MNKVNRDSLKALDYSNIGESLNVAREVNSDIHASALKSSSVVSRFLKRKMDSSFWHALFENSLDGVLLTNMEGRIIDANSTAAEILGFSIDELGLRCITDLFPEDRVAVALRLVPKALACRKLMGEFELVRKDKSRVMVEFLVAANILAGVHIVHIRNITERKKAEKVMAEQLDQLAHAQRTATMGQMAAGLAHEINQPLGAISNYAGGLIYGLQDVAADRELVDTLELIKNESQKAGAIIGRLRNFMSLDPFKVEKLDLNTSVREAAKILKDLLSSANTAVRFDPVQSMPLVQVDPIRIQQVLVNVIKNSVEAMREIAIQNRIIKVNTSSFQGWIQIRISDNGPKLTDSEFEALFTPYLTSKPNGLGIGLCISRTIIEQHRGSITMSRMIPNGMLTTLRIPCT